MREFTSPTTWLWEHLVGSSDDPSYFRSTAEQMEKGRKVRVAVPLGIAATITAIVELNQGWHEAKTVLITVGGTAVANTVGQCAWPPILRHHASELENQHLRDPDPEL